MILVFVIKTFILNDDALDIRSAVNTYIEENCFDAVTNEYLLGVQYSLRGSLFTIMLLGWVFVGMFEPNFTYWVIRKFI